jgi:VanZ family protein
VNDAVTCACDNEVMTGPIRLAPSAVGRQLTRTWLVRVVLLALLALELAFIVHLTLTPSDPVKSSPGVVQHVVRHLERRGLHWDVAELLLNVALFMPFGLLTFLLLRRALTTVVIGTALSCAIELSQHFWLPTRYARVSDVVTNAIGTALGVAVAWLAASVCRQMRARHHHATASPT